MSKEPDSIDDLAAAYIGLWRDYMTQLSQMNHAAVTGSDAAAMVNAGAEAWQKALSAYGNALVSPGSTEDRTAASGSASDDRDDVVRELHERLSALEARLSALEDE